MSKPDVARDLADMAFEGYNDEELREHAESMVESTKLTAEQLLAAGEVMYRAVYEDDDSVTIVDDFEGSAFGGDY